MTGKTSIAREFSTDNSSVDGTTIRKVEKHTSEKSDASAEPMSYEKSIPVPKEMNRSVHLNISVKTEELRKKNLISNRGPLRVTTVSSSD